MTAPSSPSVKKRSFLRRYWPWLLLAFFFFGFVSCAVKIGKAIGPRTEIKDNTVLELRLAGELRDGLSDPFEQFFGGGGNSVHDLRAALEYAKNDDRIRSVLLTVGPLQTQMGTVENIREIIEDFKKSGTPIEAFIESDYASEPELYLASATDRVTMLPSAGVFFDGLIAEVNFYRGMLDTLHIHPQFIQFKEYKSAAEPFIRKEMSPEMKEALDGVLSSIWNNILENISADRDIDESELRSLSKIGIFTAKDALENKLVDELAFRDQVEVNIDADFHSISLGDYLERTSLQRQMAVKDSPKIAVIYGEGPIVVGGKEGPDFGSEDVFSGRKVANYIRKAADDEEVKGIVLRVNSPGGSAVGSDLVWREVHRARTEKNKPVVVSMGGVAASGGYWVSMDADAIVASPSTITGSIGVLFGKFNIRGFLEWIGITTDTLKYGPNSDVMSPVSDLSPEQLALVRSWMGETYDTFINKVANGRGREASEIEPLARGRIWSGDQAQANGLVDKLGGINTAIDLCREKSGIDSDADFALKSFPTDDGFMRVLKEFNLAEVRAARADWKKAMIQAAEKNAEPRVWAISPELKIR